MKNVIPFYQILSDITEERFKGLVKNLTIFLNENGYSVSYLTVKKYMNNRSVPSFEKAKIILETLGYDSMSNEELLECIEYSSNNVESMTKYNGLRTTILLNPKQIDEELDVDEFKELINERIAQIFTDNSDMPINKRGNSFSKYLLYLIKQDFKNNKMI